MVKIRLARAGRKDMPSYKIVVIPQQAKRESKFIEQIGIYNPTTKEIKVEKERAEHWMSVGAQPTDTVKSILSSQGLLLKKHLQIGVKKGAITQETADQRLQAWKEEKDKKPLVFNLR